MAVEKHLLQNRQEQVLLLWLPMALGWLSLSVGLLGKVWLLGTVLGRVFRALVVHGSHCQLGVHACEEQMSVLVGDCHN